MHLFVVISDPLPNAPHQTLLASISTIRKRTYDITCTVEPGEHEFITSRSFVEYRMSRVEPIAVLERGIANGRIVQRDPVSQELFDRIERGFRYSDQIRFDVSDFL